MILTIFRRCTIAYTFCNVLYAQCVIKIDIHGRALKSNGRMFLFFFWFLFFPFELFYTKKNNINKKITLYTYDCTRTISVVCAPYTTTWNRNNDSESEQTVTFDVPPSSRLREEEAALVRVRDRIIRTELRKSDRARCRCTRPEYSFFCVFYYRRFGILGARFVRGRSYNFE